MLPLLAEGQLVAGFVGRRRISIGDMVVFRHEGLEKIKRVQAVGPAKVFVVGDNRLASTDSHDFGWISRSAIIGRVYWPLRVRTRKCKNTI